MIQGKKFDFRGIIDNLEITDKKIDMKNKNVLRIKKMFMSCMVIGLIVGVIIGACLLLSIFFDDSNMLLLNLLKVFVISFLAFLICTIYVYREISYMMDLNSYNKLKHFSKRKHVVYRYVMDVKSIYTARVKPAMFSVVGNALEMERQKYGMANGNVLIVNDQKVYLLDDTYHEIMFDKKIILYIAKCDNNYVLYDYERFLEEN